MLKRYLSLPLVLSARLRQRKGVKRKGDMWERKLGRRDGQRDNRENRKQAYLKDRR